MTALIDDKRRTTNSYTAAILSILQPLPHQHIGAHKRNENTSWCVLRYMHYIYIYIYISL